VFRDLPTVIVQEGGYNLSVLGRAVADFLGGLQEGETVPVRRTTIVFDNIPPGSPRPIG
jgi:acetoin utilization deacetylase AcuC-like enzyme